VTVREDSLTVGDALARHYAAHGLPADGGESNPWFRVRIGPLSVRLPNPPARQRAVFFHDVNHILTGYNTVFSDGEMVIAGFEVGTGCGRFGIAWFINLTMMAFGLVLRPRAIFHAFVRGRGCSSIYHRREDRVELRMKLVGEMKKLLALDQAVVGADLNDRIWFLAWSVVAWVVTLGAAAVALALAWVVGATVTAVARSVA
jgi:hypothetical protein